MKKKTYKDSCLLINFGNNKNVSDILKDGKFSIGIDSKFTDINFDLFDAMRKMITIENDHILDYNIIKSLNNFYSEYIEQLTRWNISDNDFPDPRYLYDDFINSLNYWYNFLKYFNISKIYIFEDPHRSYDLLIYALSKQFKIKIYIFSHLNTGYRTFIKQHIDDNLLSVKGNFPYANREISNELKYIHFNAQFVYRTNFERINDIIKKIPKIFKYHNTYIYSNRKAFIKINPFKFLIWRMKRYVRTVIYKFYYNKYAKFFIVNDSDIVFYLHYEPERTLNPLSGEGRNQLYCIKMLRKSFPQKKIYIKEHPSQLNLKNTHLNRQFRDKNFLDQLLLNSDGIINKIPNDSKFIVATLNGTVGLEYSLKGFDVICFGNPWYSFLTNVHNVKSSEDLVNIRFETNNSDKIYLELDEVLYTKSANGSVSDKFEKMIGNNEVIGDEVELLNYIKWYFSVSEGL
mgnify:CR=1 FL=1